MNESHWGVEPELLVATEDQSFGSAVAEAVEETEVAASAEYVDPATESLTQRDTEDVAGAIIDSQIAEPAAVVEHLTQQENLPAVVLGDSARNDDTIGHAVEAGATDLFPRTTTTAQYELVVERLVADDPSTNTRTLAGADTTYRQAYEALFEKISEGLVVHDPETGEIVDVNEEFCEMNGYDRSELLGEPIGVVMTEQGTYGPEAARNMIQRARTEGPQQFEWRNQHRNGDIFPVEVDLTVIELGDTERVLASVQNITERKRREQEYEQIFNSVQDAITVHDPQTGEMIDVNDTFCELVGYDRETILEMGTTGISVPAEGYTEEHAEEIIAEVMSEGQKGPYEWMVETKDGERRVTEVVATKGKIGGEDRIISINRDVTERKRREREYEQIFDGVNDIIAIHDPETGELIDVNRRMCELTGYDEETALDLGIEGLLGEHPAQDYAPDEAPMIIDRVLNGEEVDPYEQVLETSDGELVWIEVNPTRAVIGGEERFVAISRDVTERKRREREYEQIFNSVKDAITVFDPDAGEITEVNDAYREMLGYGFERIRELGIGGLSATEEGYTGDRGWELIREVAETGESETMEWRAETSEGDQIWLEVTMTSAEIGGEQRVLSIQRDVTERKRREQEFEQIFNGVQDAIAVFDVGTDTLKILDVNEAYLDMFGYDDIDEVRERGVSGLSVSEDGYTEQRALEDHQRVAESGQPEIVEWQGETSSGEHIWLEIKVAPVVIGGEQRSISVLRDVTERKRREQRLEVFNRILRHNLRNQLDVICSHAEELGDRTADEHATRIIDAVSRLAAIGRRARQIDRVMSKEVTLLEIDIAETLRETVEAMEPTRNDVTVTTDFPRELRLTTSKETVTLAVESALENALEHADSAVEVAIEDSPGECVITIADDGPGIPEEALLPIEAGKETTLQHGTGLGLWQLRWSVNKFNGDLSFETGAGTTVRITVPDRPGSTASTDTDQQPPSERAHSHEHRGR